MARLKVVPLPFCRLDRTTESRALPFCRLDRTTESRAPPVLSGLIARLKVVLPPVSSPAFFYCRSAWLRRFAAGQPRAAVPTKISLPQSSCELRVGGLGCGIGSGQRQRFFGHGD